MTVVPAPPEPVLQVSGVTKSFPGAMVLRNVGLSAHPGEIHALLGENGAGKSTLLKIIFGAEQADAGKILLDGQQVHFNRPADALRQGIAMVHQELSLIPQMSAIQNIVLGRERTRLGVIHWAAARDQALAALKLLGFSGNPSEAVKRLSIAQQQLVELARALAVDARIIILDEPTASLTSQESHQLFAILRRLRTSGHTLIYVSHRLQEVLDLADRVTVLRDGRVVASVPRQEIGGESDLVRMMVGRDLAALGIAGSGTAPGAEVLRIENFSVSGRRSGMTLSVRRGEVVGLAGMVGAGRTELARAIFGADPKDEGQIWIRGNPAAIRSPRDAINAGIAFLPEDRKSQGLVLLMTIAANITLVEPPGRWGLLNRRRQRRVAEGVLVPLNALMPVSRQVKLLSGGTQQKVVLARWLLSNSDVFIFDEPTRGIDVGAKREIHSQMRALADQGKGILMISSDLLEVLHMSDRVLVMRRGAITAELPRGQASEEVIVGHAAGVDDSGQVDSPRTAHATETKQ